MTVSGFNDATYRCDFVTCLIVLMTHLRAVIPFDLETKLQVVCWLSESVW